VARESWRTPPRWNSFELVQEVMKSVRAIRADMKLTRKNASLQNFQRNRAHP